MKAHIKITAIKQQGRIEKYEAYCELCQVVFATRRTEAALQKHIEDGGHPHPEISTSNLFRQDEVFLERTFHNELKSKLDVDDLEAKRLFDQCLKLQLIREVKKIGGAQFPGYATFKTDSLTYRKKIKEK